MDRHDIVRHDGLTVKEIYDAARPDFKLTCARSIWNKRDKATPSGKYSWRRWWELHFRDDYDEFVARERAKKHLKTGSSKA